MQTKFKWALIAAAAAMLGLPGAAGAAATSLPVPPECEASDLSAEEQSRCDFIARTPGLCLRQGLSEPTQQWCDQQRFAGEPHYNVVRLAADGPVRSVHLIETDTGREVLTAYPYGAAYAVPDERDREVRMTPDSLGSFLEERPVAGSAASQPASTDPSSASGLAIGWNDSTGSAPSTCFNFKVQDLTTPNPSEQLNLDSTSAASSTASQTDISATVKGSVDAFKLQDDFAFSDNWQSSDSSAQVYFNAFSIRTIDMVVESSNPLNDLGNTKMTDGEFVTDCGSEYLSTVTVGMYVTTRFSYSSSTESGFEKISNSFKGDTGLDSITTAVNTSKSENDSSSSFEFTVTIYGGAGPPTNDINNALSQKNDSGVPLSTSCLQNKDVADCSVFVQTVVDGVSGALSDFNTEVENLDLTAAPNLSLFAIFPSGVAGAGAADFATDSALNPPPNDVFSEYKAELSNYVDLLNQVSALKNRVNALNTLIENTPFNPTLYIDISGDYLKPLSITYTATRTSLLNDLETCLDAKDAEAETACDPIINNSAADVFAYFGEDGPEPDFFAQQNAVALQYTGNMTEVGDQTQIGSLDVMYIDELPALTAAGSNVPIAGQAAFLSFADQPWCCVNGKLANEPIAAIVALQRDADISTENLLDSVRGSDASHFTVWGLDVASVALTSPFRGTPGAFTSVLPCAPTFTSLCAIDYTESVTFFSPLQVQYDNSQILDFFTAE